MRRLILLFVLIFVFTLPGLAAEYTAPEVPREATHLVPERSDTFAEGLWHVLLACMEEIQPAAVKTGSVCLQLLGGILLLSIAKQLGTDSSGTVLRWVGVCTVGSILLRPSAILLDLGLDTLRSLSQYGKLLLPVMTAALAAQGGISTAPALYTATAFFDSILSSALEGMMKPLICLFLALSVGFEGTDQAILGKLRDLMKWAMQWSLKTILYVFTGFLTVTGVVSGSADAAALKAAKITISGVVPVVGGILSDASEAVLVGAGMMRSSVGIYGLITVSALFLSPFFQIGVQYLMVKGTGALCACFEKNGPGTLIGDFSTAMGLILACTAAQTALLLISTVCLMKGVG